MKDHSSWSEKSIKELLSSAIQDSAYRVIYVQACAFGPMMYTMYLDELKKLGVTVKGIQH